jgi:hypothetical protein
MNDRSRFREETIADFTRSWSQRRGIESIDCDASFTFVRSPLSQLSDFLAEKAIATKRDVVGSEIELSNNYVFAFQLVDHDWSIILDEANTSSLMPTLVELSQQLGQSIDLTMSYRCCTISYDLYEDGEVIESFGGEEGEPEGWFDGLSAGGYQGYVLSPYPDDPKFKQVAYFMSRRRQVKVAEIGNIWDFAERFMCEAGVYEPAIDLDYLLGYDLSECHRYKVQNPGFTLILDLTTEDKITSVPDLVRVDYFDFGT